ncbi:MAG: putative chromosome-partitioning protein ParB [Phycisphaerae bacterium]|nr:putative chromosome-partitioning protein ParB [Phycisphaerae bacterium]
MATDHNKRLGRGLSSLIGDLGRSKIEDHATVVDDRAIDGTRFTVLSIPVGLIRAHEGQPRRVIAEEGIVQLADSIKRDGLLQPVVVRPVKDGAEGVRYELVAGERRWRAAQRAGLTELPAIVREVGDQQLLQLALVENIQREDLNALDRALAYAQLRDRFALSAEQMADQVGEDRTTVTNYLRLLELPEVIREMVRQNLISMGHARALLGVSGTELQIKLAKAVVVNELSVRALEEMVRRQKSRRGGVLEEVRQNETVARRHVTELEQTFSAILGLKVTIRENRRQKNRGRIIIEYRALEEFERFCRQAGLPHKEEDFLQDFSKDQTQRILRKVR